MGRKIYLLAVLCALASCGLEEVGDKQDDEEDVWVGPGNIVSGNGGETGVGKKVWYAVGVDYPEGYDWKADEEKGSVRCSLVVFANGIPMMKIPVGDQYEVSSDPDMHRMIGNNLYTDFSTESETIVKCNGEQLFRYPGREMIVEIIEDGESVYTLGQSRDGGGFSFRMNGQVLMENKVGFVFPHLQRGEDGFSFAYYESIGSGETAQERYFHYYEGDVCQVAVREDIKKVWDIVLHDDKVCYLASLVGISAPVLAVGDEMNSLEMPASSVVRNCRFVPEVNGLNIEGMVSQRRNRVFSCLWNGYELVKMFSSGYTVTAMCGCGDGMSCILNPPMSSVHAIVYSGGETWSVPEGYRSIGGRSMTMIDGILYVGLTGNVGTSPAVWIDNEIKPLNINGFISYVSFN